MGKRYEAIVGVIIYIVYVMTMVINQQIMMAMEFLTQPLRRFFPTTVPVDIDVDHSSKGEFAINPSINHATDRRFDQRAFSRIIKKASFRSETTTMTSIISTMLR